ncbi:MAG: N-6 DNA methylase [Candidatus Poribacteria bacterium]|nr:N-6 DNA methylase [Candidatus Poribacteria bacterium]
MIDNKNFEDLLKALNFEKEENTYQKTYGDTSLLIQPTLKVDFENSKIIYPEGLKVNRDDICNLLQNENFVVFECVHRLLAKGYKPEHLELEPSWQVGHGASGGRADILVRNQENNPLLLIECKTAGKEFEIAWRKTLQNGDQLFSYAQQIQNTQYLCLYASDFEDGNISTDQRIIAHRDNEDIIAQNDELRRFSDATDVEDRYAIWCETYEQEFTTTGIFEENIQPYNIGKNKYTLEDDTDPIDADDKEGQYHKFRTILRQHNIARREQAFEVLVNLFLCKLVDEEDNKTDLQFSWKGIAYDNYFDFVDRLQNLYQIGMNKYLGKTISYISNEQIDNAFWTVRNDPNATKKQIQQYFRELKFYTNSAFSLMDTHNEDLFKRNAKVLLELVQMWQNIRLKTDNQNQFLGEMFELFLDDGVKQSEGQFFTPLPICKFIVGSLPLEQKIAENTEPLTAIDFACGSGHFLNEYAHQIMPLVEEEKREFYYKQTLGIEKEDRLAKVAKVAAYMHGQDQIQILDIDALADLPKITKEGFDVLVANPPFAVDGFLHTLSKHDKQQYQLIQATGEDSDTNTIQCFFLERIHHLMAPNGVVGVIVPSSILSNVDAVHMGTREIILKYFDLISLAQLGSGTFGETGTNTVVLFLKRKKQSPESAEHYDNRVKNFFEGDKERKIYRDHHLIKAYCKHIEIPYKEYKKLFNQTSLDPIAGLLEHDIFKDYEKDFNPDKELGKIEKSKDFRDKTDDEKSEELGRHFIAYLHDKEKEKLYYFILAHTQKNKVLIVKAPKDKREQKTFLGYEWSKAKGREGIKYIGGDTVKNIITPLFDPDNLKNPTKINNAIKRNFIGDPIDELPEHCYYANLTDMLDFSRIDFNKAINLNPNVNLDIETQSDLVRLGEICKLYQPQTITSHEIKEQGDYKVYGANGVIGYYNEYNHELPEVVVTCRGATCGTINFTEPKVWITGNAMVVQPITDNILKKYLFEILNFCDLSSTITGAAQPQITRENLSPYKIPLPRVSEQRVIIKECETVDQKSDKARQTISAARQEIEELVSSVEKTSTLNQVVDKISDVVDPQEENGTVCYIGLENIESQTGVLSGDIQTDYSTIKSNKNVFHIGDILYGKLRPNLNKVFLANIDGICSTDILVLRPNNPNLATFYKHYFLSEAFNSEVLTTVSGQQLPRTSWEKINRIPVPPPNIPQQLVAEIDQLETKISEAQDVLDEATERKNAILTKHLQKTEENETPTTTQ